MQKDNELYDYPIFEPAAAKLDLVNQSIHESFCSMSQTQASVASFDTLKPFAAVFAPGAVPSTGAEGQLVGQGLKSEGRAEGRVGPPSQQKRHRTSIACEHCHLAKARVRKTYCAVSLLC